jgi:hypothetical protein
MSTARGGEWQELGGKFGLREWAGKKGLCDRLADGTYETNELGLFAGVPAVGPFADGGRLR